MKHTIPHGLGQDLALRACRRALETYRQHYPEYHPKADWVATNRAAVEFTILGRTLKGTVAVEADAVDLVLDIPLMFRPFQNVAMRVVEEEIEKWLDRAKRGELEED